MEWYDKCRFAWKECARDCDLRRSVIDAMKESVRCLPGLVEVATLVLGTTLLAQPGKLEPSAEVFHPTRVLAKFATTQRAGTLAAALQEQRLNIKRQFRTLPRVVVLELEPGASAGLMALAPPDRSKRLLQRIAALRASGLFEYVEPDYIRLLNLEPTDSAYTDGTLWPLHNVGQNNGLPGADIGALAAWDITTGSTNVIVALVDTGIRYTHRDLVANMWRNPGESGGGKEGNGVDDDGDGYIDDVYGINALLGAGSVHGGDPMDDCGHGTHVAGTIGAAANNGHPHVGVAWKVRLMACKAFDEKGGNSSYKDYVSDTVECIDFAVVKGARIINASYGFPAFSQAEYEAIQAARGRGILFVAAAGNDGLDNDTASLRSYPASYDLENIISVAALDRTDRLATDSSFGQTRVHLGAPGVDIFSCWNTSDTAYRTLKGTSMAAPHVVGAAGLVLSHHPSASLTELRRRILDGAVPIPSFTNKTVTGGRLNVFNSLVAAQHGALAVEVIPPSGQFLVAGEPAVLAAVISDLLPVTNAAVTTSGATFTNLVFLDSGVAPDAILGDGVYTTAFVVPTNLDHIEMTLSVSAPGWPAETNRLSYPVVARPPNDRFADRLTIQPSRCPTSVTGANVNASRESAEPEHAGSPIGRSVWWSWTAPFSGPVKVTTAGSNLDTLLAVYTGPTLASLTLIVANDDAGGRDFYSSVRFEAAAGTEYQIAADGYFMAQGQIRLTVLPLDSTTPLADALDAPALSPSSGGDEPWLGQVCASHDGTDAARSGPLDAYGQTWLETAVVGPGTLSFWWRVSSEANCDYLRFALNGKEQAALSGEVDWEQRRFWLGTGTNALRWVYAKNRDVSAGQDAGWVDQAAFTPAASAIPGSMGDLDGDGQPTVLDLTLLTGYLRDTTTLRPQVAVFADVNRDALINTADIPAMADTILERSSLLPELDTDGDGIPDLLEPLLGLSPGSTNSLGGSLADGDLDFDYDGVANARELQLGTDPLLADSDGDRWDDASEILSGTNPNDPRSGPAVQVTSTAMVAYLNAVEAQPPPNAGWSATALTVTYLNAIQHSVPANTTWTASALSVSYLNAHLESAPTNAPWSVASLPVSFLNAMQVPAPSHAIWSSASPAVSFLNARQEPPPTSAVWVLTSHHVSYLNARQDAVRGSLFFVSPVVSFSNSPPGQLIGQSVLSSQPGSSEEKNSPIVYEH